MSVDKYVKFISEQQKSMVNAGLANPINENYTHEIDVHPHGWEGASKEQHEKGTDKMVAKLKKQGFHAKVHMYHGPGGGAAVLHLGHPKGPKHVDKWLQKNYDEDHEEGDSRIHEAYINMLHMYIENLESHFEAEDLQQIQELSKGTLGSYIKKASDNKAYHDRTAGIGVGSDGDADEIEAHLDKSDNRKAGINRAVKKLTK